MNEEDVFLEALEIESPEARARFLDSACRDFPGARAKIEHLLESHSTAGDFLLKPPHEMLETALSQLTDDPSSRASQDASDDEAQPSLDFLESSQREGSLGRLGTYEVLELVAHGGTGIVLRATDTKLNREVALKVLKHHCLEWPNARANFLREARAAAAIRSDHVVTVFAVEDEHSVPFLAMEFIEGESLQQKLDREGPFSIAEILDVGRQIAAGLAVAHSQNLIHRDIKPANILIERETGRVQITDFGLARAVKESGNTPLGLMSGTPQYMSPEQAEGKPIDHRSDLFSLGSVLYALTTGSPPFRSSNSLAVLRRVVEQQPQALNETRPGLPPAFVEFVKRLLEKSPGQRPQSADEIVECLSNFTQNIDHASSRLANESNDVTDRTVPIDQRTTKVGRAPTSAHFGRNSRWLKAAMFFLTAAASLAVIVLIVKNRNGQSTTFTIPEGSGVDVSSHGSVVVDLANVVDPDTRRVIPGSEDTVPKSTLTTKKSDAGRSDATRSAPKEVGPINPLIAKTSSPPPANVPFFLHKAKQHQEAWAKHLGAPVELTLATGLKLSLIPPGTFAMGTSQAEVDALMATPVNDGWLRNYLKTLPPNELPQHQVELTEPFYISQTEITVAQFRQFVEATGYESQIETSGLSGVSYAKGLTRNVSPHWTWRNPGYKQTDQHPVVQVTWQDAAAFCDWLSTFTGSSVALPTEAQWEFACRAGSDKRMFFGDPSALLQEYIVRASPYGAKPVGTKNPNPFGLFDVYSNVWEWCSDYYSTDYYANSTDTDPTGPTHGQTHTIRGCSYRDAQQIIGSACRSAPLGSDLSADNLGFRVAITGDLTKVGQHTQPPE